VYFPEEQLYKTIISKVASYHCDRVSCSEEGHKLEVSENKGLGKILFICERLSNSGYYIMWCSVTHTGHRILL
jgi:hypothetical protein